MKVEKIKLWIEAFRPKTLPLALSSSLMGSFLAVAENKFILEVAIFSALTAIFLQILSNLSNDYGDFLKKADLPERIGPKRGIHTNEIKPDEIKRAIFLFIFLALFSGILLIHFGTKNSKIYIKIIYLFMGLIAIYSALKYTIGKKPLGYRGLGDLFVFLFFGLIGVFGTYYLHTNSLNLKVLLPSLSIGFLSVGVLNINNIRDFNNDKIVNKKTFAVMIGLKFAKLYHCLLISLAIIFAVIFNILNYASIFQYIFLFTLPLLINNVYTIFTFKEPIKLNSQLKNLSFTTLLFTILLGIGQILK